MGRPYAGGDATRSRSAHTTFASANLDVSGEPSLAALAADGSIAASTIVKEKGERIGVIGLTTPLLPTTPPPAPSSPGPSWPRSPSRRWTC